MNENNGWVMEEMARLDREERLREAEQYHLAKLAMANKAGIGSLVSRILYQIGESLFTWGASLKERYRCEAELSISPAGDCR